MLVELGIHPSKALGQNFLVDANVLAILLGVIGAAPDDEILEIGPGLGVLTGPLTHVARRVVAVEKDRRLHAWLMTRFAGCRNLELICGDMLLTDHEALLRSGINKVVSNLPYSVGSAILVNFLGAETPPARMIFTMQAEVARRLTAAPHAPDFGLLSLWSRLSYDVEIRKIVSPGCFYPAPVVKSAVIHMARRNPPIAAAPEKKLFFEITKFAFSHRRKQLKTLFREQPEGLSFRVGSVLDAFRSLGLDVTARPETFSVETWLEATRKVYRTQAR